MKLLWFIPISALALGCESADPEPWGKLPSKPAAASPLQAELDAVYTDKKNAVTARSKAWQVALRQARSDEVHASARGECPYRIDPMFVGLDKSSDGLGIEALPSLTADPSLFVAEAELGKMFSPRGRVLMKHLFALKKGAVDYEAMAIRDRLARAKSLGHDGYWTWDFAVVVDEQVAAGNVDREESTFRAGALIGTAYIYDYGKGRVTCAGAFDATSSETLTVRDQEGDFEGTSSVDLAMNAARRAVASLRAVRPVEP